MGVASRPSSAVPLEESSVRLGDRPILYKRNGLADVLGNLFYWADHRSECGFGANVQVDSESHLLF